MAEACYFVTKQATLRGRDRVRAALLGSAQVWPSGLGYQKQSFRSFPSRCHKRELLGCYITPLATCTIHTHPTHERERSLECHQDWHFCQSYPFRRVSDIESANGWLARRRRGILASPVTVGAKVQQKVLTRTTIPPNSSREHAGTSVRPVTGE